MIAEARAAGEETGLECIYIGASTRGVYQRAQQSYISEKHARAYGPMRLVILGVLCKPLQC